MSLQKKMMTDFDLSMSPHWSIFRSPKILPRHSPYEPTGFSFGPFHYGKEQLKPTQEIKWKYMHDLLRRSGGSEENGYKQLIESITSIQEDACRCYAGRIETCDEEEFVEILVLDGCFIIELFRKDAKKKPEPDDPIFTVACLQEFLSHDLVLLENQIPWLVLERLFTLTKVSEHESLIQLTLDYFRTIFSSDRPPIKIELFQKPETNIKHILDLLRYSLLLPLPISEERYGWELFPSATKISQSGIKFQANKSAHSILDIKFDNGVLKIPTLLVHETTDIILRNLISLEQCCPAYQPTVTSYAKLMDDLVDTEKDVEILCNNGILDNWLNPEDATRFFNNLCMDAYFKEFHYCKISVEVKSYQKRWWPTWRSFYIRYFGTPWAIVSHYPSNSQLHTDLLFDFRCCSRAKMLTWCLPILLFELFFL